MQPSEIERDYSLIKVQAAAVVPVPEKNEKIFVADGKKFLDKKAALQELYEVLGFTDYIPYANYDGFDELISPDMWPDARTLTLQIINADALKLMGEEDLRILLSVLQSNAEEWKSIGKVLDVTLVK